MRFKREDTVQIIAGKDKLEARQKEEAQKKAAEEQKAKLKEKERSTTDLEEARSKPYSAPQPAPGASEASAEKSKPSIVVTPGKKTSEAKDTSDSDDDSATTVGDSAETK